MTKASEDKPDDEKLPKKGVRALRVKQWMRGWDRVEFSEEGHRRKPDPSFLIFSISAIELRSLCGIYRRTATKPSSRAEDLGIQRQHDKERSDEIARFVEYGFPWSTLSEARRQSTEFNDLRKPGWLPTSIVINILRKDDARRGVAVDADDQVMVEDADGETIVRLPYKKWSKDWRPQGLPPFEVIDGQHRLFAFEDEDPNFELPVVAFAGLDVSWQAYLFWTINIKPKKINPSLAFDLYPLLRGEDWLDRAEGHAVYRETRAQELTESLWTHPESPWYDRINMLGERRVPWVTQSAWIKSLTSTMVRPWKGRGSSIGGLFGGRLGDDEEVLGWSRAQQAAFLILAWSLLRTSVFNSDAEWARALRAGQLKRGQVEGKLTEKNDPAFYAETSLISTDQGVRGVLHVLNDICFMSASRWDLRSWRADEGAAAADEKAVSAALKTLQAHKVAKLLASLAETIAGYDWRSSADDSLSSDERRRRLVFRGSGGYKELRTQLLECIVAENADLKSPAQRALDVIT